ncbi:PKD domain-containing protein [Luteipulveratus halotolerans]|uniref:PKD domain-containing protein n=1 Tax=Luteipulveratus halotolerans TaxID=1631356 RepID=UPI000680F572|nr:NlpC/P60 family protein [Luteipulveratus halotolerans]
MTITANAGADTSAAAFDRVTLDGSASASTDGLVRDYAWTQTAGTTVSLTKDGPRCSFVAPGGLGETLRFQLVVTDQNGTASAADTVDVAVGRAKVLKHYGGAWRGVRRLRSLTSPYAVERAANPARSIVTASDGSEAVMTDGARTVLVRGPQLGERTFAQSDVPLTDTFPRTRTGTGWGVAERGGKWSCTGGTLADFSATNGSATITLSTDSSSRRAVLGNYQLAGALVGVDITRPVVTVGSLCAGVVVGYQDTSNHYRVRLLNRAPKVVDDFDRTVPSGWGTATTGHPWLFAGGDAGDYATAGAGDPRAVHALTTVNSSRRSYVQVGASDVDVTVGVQCSVVAAGGGITGAVMLRYKDSSNHYLARVRFGEDGKVYAILQSVVAGTVTDLVTTTDTGLTYAADTFVNVRAKQVGADLYLRVWADGAQEPGEWTVQATDTAITGTGAVGLRSYALGSTTNTLPVRVRYRAFTAVIDGNDNVGTVLEVHRFQESTATLLGSHTYPSGAMPAPDGQPLRLWVQHSDGQVRACVTATDVPEVPYAWDVAVDDPTWSSGRAGVIASSSGISSPVVRFANYACTGQVVDPAQVVTPWRVRVLPSPFGGIVTADLQSWLAQALVDTSEDVLDIAAAFTPAAAVATRGVVQVRGPASYGPYSTDGTGGRQEGGDLNDYMNLTWDYAGTKDAPEADQAAVRSLDCSGFVRMVYGPAGAGLKVTNGNGGGTAIPRISKDQVGSTAPGVQIIAHTGAVAPDPALIATLQVGDIIGFDATSDPEEEEGQVDHVGIYLGLDVNGHPRFISSRKTPNGPTMSDTGGNSTIDGTGLYARAWRSARRY